MVESFVNPLFLYLLVWCVATALYVVGACAGVFPRYVPQVVWVVVLNVGAFTLGYLTAHMLGLLGPQRGDLPGSQGIPVTAERFRRYLKATLACGVLALLLCTLRLVIVVARSEFTLPQLASNLDLLRGRLVDYVNSGVNRTRLTTMAISITSSLTSLGFVLLGLLLYVGRRRSRYVYLTLFLLLSLALAVLNLSRKGFMVDLLFLTLSYLWAHHLYRLKKNAEVLRNLLVPAACIAVLFVVIELLLGKSHLYNPRDRIAGFLFAIYWYTSAPLAAFGEFLTSWKGDYLMGQSLFLPLYKWLTRLGVAPPSTVALYANKLYIPHMVNVYSYLRNIYEDFGIFGVAIVPYLLGWISSALRVRANLLLPYLNIYLILLVMIVFSFYNYLLVTNQFYLQAFFGLAFFRFRLQGLEHVDL
ncbi:MAG: O-antigen polymerase [Anaerolineae bacterium]